MHAKATVGSILKPELLLMRSSNLSHVEKNDVNEACCMKAIRIICKNQIIYRLVNPAISLTNRASLKHEYNIQLSLINYILVK